MTGRIWLALLLPLAACAADAPPLTQEQACSARANDDPAVHDLMVKAADPDYLWQNAEKIKAAKQRAISRCLQGRGFRNRGGVEAPL